jgi:aryl-alcohol dehydrogenase-like predicted oxidoreductase
MGAGMHYKPLGLTGMQVSLLGYGGWALGKKGWPGVDEREALSTLEAAIASGINFFDTAPIYGFGRSEEVLGDALSGMRQKIFIATKCGLRWDDRGHVRHDLTADSIMWEIEQSLKRLKTDYIDLYQIHWPDKTTPIEKILITLCTLKKQGVIRHIGLCNFTAELITQALCHAPIASVQQRYNMLERDAEADILTLCGDHHLGFICYSPLAQGLLAGNFTRDYTPGSRDVRRLNPLYRNREAFEAGIALVEKIKPRPAAEALAFVARQQAVSTMLVSMTQRRHLAENCRALTRIIH